MHLKSVNRECVCLCDKERMCGRRSIFYSFVVHVILKGSSPHKSLTELLGILYQDPSITLFLPSPALNSISSK